MKDDKDYKLIDEIGHSIEWLQLTKDEKIALKELQSLTLAQHQEMAAILNKYCPTAISYVRLAIFNKKVLEFCRRHERKTWLDFLTLICESKPFSYKFKEPKKLPLFDLMAGLLLINQTAYANSENEKTLIFYLAAEKFLSVHACFRIIEKSIKKLEKPEIILSMRRILDKVAYMQGCSGYLLYCWFAKEVGNFYEATNREKEAASAYFLSYQYLCTAFQLVQWSRNELHNAMWKDLGFDIDPEFPEKTLSTRVQEFKENFQYFLAPVQSAAESNAKKLSQGWRLSKGF